MAKDNNMLSYDYFSNTMFGITENTEKSGGLIIEDFILPAFKQQHSSKEASGLIKNL